MSNKILIDAGYQGIVRDKMGLDTTILPDSKVDRMDGVELAEKLVILRLTDAKLNYSTILSGDDALYLKMGTIYCVCGLLARGFGQGVMRSEKLPDYQYENFKIDMKEREKDFWDKVDENLVKITGYTIPEKGILEFLEGYTEATEETEGTSSPY